MIAIDIDGVIADSEQFLVHGLELYTGQKFNPPSPRTYDFRDGFDGLSLNDCLDCIDRVLVEYNDQIPVINHDRTYFALAKVQKQYGIIHFITARNPSIFEYTDIWLKNNFGGLKYRLHSLGHISNKELLMYKYNCNVLVEDNLDAVNNLKNPHNMAYLITQSWNNNRYIRGHVIRVKDLLEAVNHHLGEPDV